MGPHHLLTPAGPHRSRPRRYHTHRVEFASGRLDFHGSSWSARTARGPSRAPARHNEPAGGGPEMKRVALLSAVVVLLVLSSAPASAQAPGKWIKLAALPEAAEELYGAAAGGKMYV